MTVKQFIYERSLLWLLPMFSVLGILPTWSQKSYEDYKDVRYVYTPASKSYKVEKCLISKAEFRIADSIAGYPVTGIESYAFSSANEKLMVVYLPSGIKTIGDYAFGDCEKLQEVYTDSIFIGKSYQYISALPDSLERIGTKAFLRCSTLSLRGDFPRNLKKIGARAFEDCECQYSITLPDGLTSLGDYTFNGCTSLSSITLPDGLTSLGDYTFNGCTSLSSITLPDGLTSLGDHTFGGCTSLRSITLPDGLTSLGNNTFTNCTSLSSITLPDGLTSLGDKTFYGCTSLRSITLPDGLTSLGDKTFYGCTSLSSITLPDGLTSLGNYTFTNCESLSSITLPDGLTSLGYGTFKGCESLSSITLPDGLTSLSDQTFYGCTSLKDVVLSNHLATLNEIFDGCTSLRSITLPNGLKRLEYWTFKSCNINYLTIPNSVTTIVENAFLDCNIQSLFIPESVTSMGKNVLNPYLLQGTLDILQKVGTNNLQSLRFVGKGSVQTVNTPQLSYIDVKSSLNSLTCFTGVGNLFVHLNKGVTYPSDFMKGSNVVMMNIPADVHEFNYELPNTNVTLFVESDSLYITTSLREGDKIVCVSPSGTKVVSNFDLIDYGGTWYGNFVGYIKDDGDLVENPIFVPNQADNRLLKLYDLLCVEPAVIDMLQEKLEEYTESERSTIYSCLRSNLYPFSQLQSASLTELQSRYDNICSSNKVVLQTLYDKCERLCKDNVYPYIDNNVKGTFDSAMTEASAVLTEQNVDRVVAIKVSLQTAYDAMVLAISRYNEALQDSQNRLKSLYATCNEVGKTTYTDIYPYIDDDTKSAFLATLNEAQTLFEDYDNDKVTAARTKLQTSYDAIVAEVKRYKESLQESKQQLLSLCSTCSKVGTSTYTDIYPYIDSTAKETLTAAIAKAQSDVVAQTNDVKEVQAAKDQLQTAYDKVMALISTYNETLANNQKAILQQIQTEGNLKSEAEYTSIDYAIRQAYEQAINNAKSVRYSKDVTVITNAMESLHQNYESVCNAINELTKDLISPKEALRDQLSHCHDYDADAAYFSGDDLREATSRAEAALNGYDVNYINDCTTTLRDVLSAIETEIATNKAKEQEVRQLFEDSYVVLSDISQYVSDIDKEQHDYITEFNLYDEYPQFKEISIGDSVYANSDQTFYRYASNVFDAQKALSKMNDNLNNVGYDNNQLKFYDNRDDADRKCLCTYDYAEILRDFIAWGRKSIDEINATQQNDSAWIIDKRDRIEAMMADECFSYLSDHVKWSLSEYWKRCYSYNWNKYAQRIYIILEFYNKKVNEDYTVAAIYLESVAPLRALISKARSLQADEYAELYASVDEEDRNSLNEAITQAQSCIEKADVENIPTVQATLQQVYYTIYGTMYVTLNQQCNEWVAKAEQLKVDYADVYELLSEEDALKLSNAVADVKNADNLENLYQAMQQLIAVYNEVSEKLDALRTTTAITNIKEFDSTTRIYDLKGRRVVVKDMRSLKPGVYIINGRKVMIK